MESNSNKFYANWILSLSLVNVISLIVLMIYPSFFMAWIILSALLFLLLIRIIFISISNQKLRIGYANWISTFRLCLIFVLLIFHSQLDDLTLFIGFFVAILLDGVDGYVARRFNEVSDLGAKFDMEIDAFLVFSLSWLHVSQETIHVWMLIPGSFRYLYELLFFWTRQGQKEPLPKMVRATIAVFFFLALIIPFAWQEQWVYYVLYASGILILFSFGFTILKDIMYTIRS